MLSGVLKNTKAIKWVKHILNFKETLLTFRMTHASETTCKRFVNKFLQKKNLIAKFD